MRSAFIYIYITLFSFLSAFGTEKISYEDACKEYWKDNKDVTEVPQKWEDESAVVLYRYTYNSYEKVSMEREIEHKNVYRERIKLIDKSAVSKYSEFEFDPLVKTAYTYKNIFGVKIIKPSGKVEIISLDQAIDIKENDKVVKKKIAIPNLNVGDIIDYFYVEVEEMSTTAKSKIFTPVYYSLIDEHPILNQKIEFKVLRRCYINIKSLNGAPEITTIPTTNEEYDSYAVIDKDREKEKATNWIFKYRQSPTIKFQIAFARSGQSVNSEFFPGTQGRIKKTVYKKEIVELIDENLDRIEDYRIIKFFEEEPNNNLKGQDFIAKVNEVCKIRMRMHKRRYSNGRNLSGDFRSINYISTFLKSQKIKHNIIIAPRKHLSSLDDIIMVNDVFFFLKVILDNKTYFIYPPSPFTNQNEINPEVEGVEAYELKLYPTKESTLNKITLPTIDAKENTSTLVSRVYIDKEDEYKVSVSNIATYNYVQKFMKHSIYPYNLSEIKESTNYVISNYISETYGSAYSNYLLTQPNYYRISWRGIINHSVNRYDDAIEYFDYNVTESGVSLLRPTMVVDTYLKLKNYVYKVGDNYVLDAGRLLGSQVKIDEDNLEREKDIYSDAARTYNNSVYIDIPKGYTVKGLDQLNKEVDNICGTFSCSAKVENNQLIITSKKVYKSSYEPAANWDKLLEMLDLAWETTQAKVLLKKEN